MKKYEHGGCAPNSGIIYDFSANINPLGTPESVKNAAVAAVELCGKYPDPNCMELVREISYAENIPSERIVVSNGAADMIYRIVHALKPQKALVFSPTFSEYEKALSETGCMIIRCPLDESSGFAYTDHILRYLSDDVDICFLCSPNNPNGGIISPALLDSLAQLCHNMGITLVVDHCFLDFTEMAEAYSAVRCLYDNVIVLKAFTKLFAIPGLRLGYALFGSKQTADLASGCGQCWSVSTVAQAAGIAAVKEALCGDFVKRTVEYISCERKLLIDNLRSLGITVFDSSANFLLIKTDHRIYEPLFREGMAIRRCDNFIGLNIDFYRLAVRTHDENAALIRAVRRIMNG